jgi:sodium/pantothenate symporter
MSGNLATLIPVVLFLALSIGIAVYERRKSKAEGGGFVSEYFIGNRGLGGFVLAMTTIATYGSVSSFVGGPGQAWNVGFGWVYMATVQVTALFLLFGIMGKKMALISRRINAVTVIDVIRARYNSDALANVSAVIIVLFFAATMVAQFVGGAKLFEAVTGYSYVIGLALFGIAVILYTTIGGFRGVAVTDALCGIAMIVGIIVLAWGILSAGGGYTQVMQTIEDTKPSMLEPLGGGSMPVGLYFTQWLLVGVLTFCLPQSVVRTLGFKDERSLKQAMVMGTVIIGFMMIVVTALGVLAKGIMPEDLSAYGGSVDNIIPLAIVSSLPSWLAGIAIIGPIAASISTVSSLLIASSSAIVKDVYLHRCSQRGVQVSDRKVARLSQMFTLAVGIIVFVLAIVPPDVIWKINMFAFGGLETAFCWVFACGLFWKRANRAGALASMTIGTVVYCLCMAIGFKPFGLHQIVIGITVSLVCMVVGSYLGKPETRNQEVFFPE